MKSPYDTTLLEQIKDILIKKRQTLSVAESVTSGHLQAAFSQATEASAFFQGGITVYNAGQKTKHLNVEPIFALSCNCIDPAITDKMALQANTLFISDYAIGITGYAAPLPEKDIYDLYAFIAIARQQHIIIRKQVKLKSNLNSYQAQIQYTNEAIKLLFESLKA